MFNHNKTLENITLGSCVNYIGEWAFSQCTNLKTIILPDSLKTLDNLAFNGCTGLESITLNNGLESIGENAFQNCQSLKEITIPESVKLINPRAFYYCDALESVTILNPLCHIEPSETNLVEENTVLYGYESSTTKTYAKKQNVTFSSLGEYEGVKKGDVNLDGEVTIMDATMIQRKTADIITLDELQSHNADTSGGFFVNVMDATLIQRFLAKYESEL